MNINTLSFPFSTVRWKKNIPIHPLPINNQRHHPASSVQHTHSSIENSYGTESFLPSVPTTASSHVKSRPYQLNDFANNHLFIAKRKLAPVFLPQPTRKSQSTNDLLHLFDQQEPKRKNRNTNTSKRQESTVYRTPSFEQNLNHIPVVNLNVNPPSSSTKHRERLSAGLIRPFEVWSGVKSFWPS